MSALHLMTFNVQCLPLGANIYNGVSHDAVGRASRIATDLLTLAPRDRPDVITFNEVFSEEARDVFVDRLSGTWPHVIKEIDGGGFGDIDDSGLMVFSRFPFVPINGGANLVTGFYEDAAGSDQLAPKGFGIVRIDTPIQPTTIVLTHLQASYDAEDQYREIRVKQFNAINAALDSLFASELMTLGGALLVGDLNVRGDPERLTDEWKQVFTNAATLLFAKLQDGWSTYMHPPNDKQHDPGYTNIDPKTGHRQRLDYVCTAQPFISPRSLVPHHMFTRFRTQSDHFALEAILQQPSRHCTPSDAIDVLTQGPALGGTDTSPSAVWFMNVKFAHDGSYQWLFVKEPGTFTVWTSDENQKPLDADVFEFDDLSRPLTWADTFDAVSLSDLLPSTFFNNPVDVVGRTIVTRKPFFIAARKQSRNRGGGFVAVMRHGGESKATAILLPAHFTVDTTFSPGQKLGDDDICWFKAKMPLTYSGATRAEKFQVINPTGKNVRIAFESDGPALPHATENNDPTLDLIHETNGLSANDAPETVWLKITRADQSVTGFKVRWICPLSFLMLDESIRLFIEDETGTDAFGDDEASLAIVVDSDPLALFSGEWDEADTGEDWPGLAQAIRENAQKRLPGAKRMGFVDSLTILYGEDDFTAQSQQVEIVSALTAADKEVTERSVSLPVADVTKDGTYVFFCRLTKIP